MLPIFETSKTLDIAQLSIRRWASRAGTRTCRAVCVPLALGEREAELRLRGRLCKILPTAPEVGTKAPRTVHTTLRRVLVRGIRR